MKAQTNQNKRKEGSQRKKEIKGISSCHVTQLNNKTIKQQRQVLAFVIDEETTKEVEKEKVERGKGMEEEEK